MTYLGTEYRHVKRSAFPSAFAQWVQRQAWWPTHARWIVDIGSGTGDFLHAFEAGVGRDRRRLWAMDRENGLRSGYGGTIDYMPWDFASPIRKQFEFALCKSVIEHQDDPVTFLQYLAEGVERGGILLVVAPDFETCCYDFYDDPTHIRPLTLKGLEQAVHMAGLQLVASGRITQTPMLLNHPFLAYLWRVLIGPRLSVALTRYTGIEWFRHAGQQAAYVVIRG